MVRTMLSTQVLRDFQNQSLALVLDVKRAQNLGQVALELDVHDRAHNLCNFADVVFCHRYRSVALRRLCKVRALPRPR